MIYIGLAEADKETIIEQYAAKHGIRNTVVISPKQFPLEPNWTDNVEWSDTIEYPTFYRLLEEVQADSLIVLSEPLRTQNRYDLTYNCIRHFLNQTEHQIIFQMLPQIDQRDDFMILFDFDTRSRWKRRKWDINLILDNCRVEVRPLPISFEVICVPTTAATQKRYAKEKKRRFDELGARDPHTIPRNLYLIGGRDKRDYIDKQAGPQLPLFGTNNSGGYVARNQRLARDNITTYKLATAGQRYTIVEFPHRFITLSDFMKRVGQTEFQILTADLKVDRWYLQRYQDWSKRVNETYASLLER